MELTDLVRQIAKRERSPLTIINRASGQAAVKRTGFIVQVAGEEISDEPDSPIWTARVQSFIDATNSGWLGWWDTREDDGTRGVAAIAWTEDQAEAVHIANQYKAGFLFDCARQEAGRIMSKSELESFLMEAMTKSVAGTDKLPPAAIDLQDPIAKQPTVSLYERAP